MKPFKLVSHILSTSVALSCWLAQADTWYADAKNHGKSNMDGKTPETAFGVIQEAIDCAKDDDTVRVAEGVYDQGSPTCATGAMNARVSITNKITLVASGAKEKTVIVGCHASDSSGIGADAVRCVYMSDGAGGAVVRGFTIRDGGVKESVLGATGSGGGVYAGNTYDSGNLVIDCDIVNCVGSRGGAVKGGVSVRCRFLACSCNHNGAVGRDAAFWNCLAVANGTKPNLFENCRLVNCTVIGNATSAIGSGSYALNTICADNDTSNGSSSMKTCKGSVFALPNAAGATLAGGMENTVCDETANYAVIAPLFGDFRVVKGHPAETSGRLSYMTEAGFHEKIPEAERYLDLNGNAIVEKDGSICAGALQETAVRANCGGIVGAGVGKWTVCGCPNTTTNLWAFPNVYPAYVTIDQFVGDTNLIAFAYGSAFNDYRQPLMDGTICVLPPVRSADMQPIEPIFAKSVIHVNPNPSVGSDATGDGSVGAPYETISNAIAHASDSTLTRIVCAAGTYAKDGDLTTCHSHRARVYIPSKKYVFLKGAGAGKSTIKGLAVSDGTWGGCGENAAKCVAADAAYCGLQGFTLADGFAYGTDVNQSQNQGGAIRAHISSSTENIIVSDVVITNCGARSGAVFGGNYERCEFVGCTAPYAIIREANFVTSCFLHGNDSGSSGSLYYEYPVYDTTVIAASGNLVFPSGQQCFNTIAYGGSVLGAPKSAEEGYPGCLFYGMSTYKVTPEAAFYVKADPQFAGAIVSGDGDGRLLSASPAFGTAGATMTVSDTWITNYHRYATADLKGQARQFVNGKTVPGAFTWAVAKVTVSNPLVGTTTESGDHYVYRNDSLTVVYSPDADAKKARNFLGYATNGVIATTSMTYTLSGVEAGSSYSLVPVISTNWYVNACAQDDDGNGFTPETAKKTLRAIMEDVYMLPGDCVHAAEGDYNEGVMFPKNGTYSTTLFGVTTNRVVINEGISLVADGACEKTFIRGAKSNTSSGCGAGALRCAFMYPNTLLKGFTITDGATGMDSSPTSNEYVDDHSGGGILAKSVNATAYVEGCVFTNCSARNGGGAFGGYMVNCRFVDCKVNNMGGALRNCEGLYGCVIENGSVNGPYGIDSCTFGPSSSLSDYGGSNINSYKLKNTLFLGTLTSGTSRKFTVSNCLFKEGCGVADGVTAGNIALDRPQSDIVLSAEELAVDERFMPTRGSAAIDAGSNSTIPSELHEVDALGHQRIWNGTVDIGAVEYDWRGDYAAALGGSRLEVTVASPDVTLENGKVNLVDGSKLTVVWNGVQPTRSRWYEASVAGTGTLAVSLNGGNPEFVTTDGSGTKRYRADTMTDVLNFAYIGDGAAQLSDFVSNKGFAVIVR